MKLVRLNLSEEEYKVVYDQALENGLASIPEYLRYLLFSEESETIIDYKELLKQFEHSVNRIKDHKEFRVRDCFDPSVWASIKISNRRALGRMIIHKVEKGGWLPIVPTKKDSGNAQWYKKRSE